MVMLLSHAGCRERSVNTTSRSPHTPSRLFRVYVQQAWVDWARWSPKRNIRPTFLSWIKELDAHSGIWSENDFLLFWYLVIHRIEKQNKQKNKKKFLLRLQLSENSVSSWEECGILFIYLFSYFYKIWGVVEIFVYSVWQRIVAFFYVKFFNSVGEVGGGELWLCDMCGE